MYLDSHGQTWYQLQLHCHTKRSDGRLTPEEVAEVYKKAGFDAIAMTDHWVYHGAEEVAGLPVLSGCEYNMGGNDTALDTLHIVGVGMDRDPGLIRGDCTRQQVFDAIREAGGYAIFAHPAWSLNTPEDATALRGIDAVEIYNAVSEEGQSRRAYSDYFVDLLANRGAFYPLIATDDAHYYGGVDNARGFVRVKADGLAREELLRALRAGDFYATQGPHLTLERQGEKLVVHCSPCVEVNFCSNMAWVPDRIHLGEALTEATYTVKSGEKWVRAEVKDSHGNRAWSNIIVL